MGIQKLEIRRLKEEELGDALKLVWEVFEKEIAPSYTAEGVQAFLNFINYGIMKEQSDNGEIVFWGAFEEELIGTMAVRSDGHISLFFVKNEYQGFGVGKALFQMMYNYCVEELKVTKITVNATPQSVAKYIHMGMRQMGNLEERDGIRSMPMEMYASPSLVKSIEFGKKAGRKDKKKEWLIVGILALVLALGLGFTGWKVLKNIFNLQISKNGEDVFSFGEEEDQGGFGEGAGKGSGNFGTGDEGSENSGAVSDELSGVDAIPAYEAENLPYEITTEKYNFVDQDKVNTIIEFGVQYPKLTPLDDASSDTIEIIENVNQVIYEDAMCMVDAIYTNPSDEIKETVLHAETPVLVSYVTYKVTYADEDFISIVMEDQGYAGSQEEYYYDFRTLNISLVTGEVYEVKDIINVDQAFIKDWLMTMRSEADNSKLLDELNKKELIDVLCGDSKDGVYEVEYFFNEEGIEIGFAFDYAENDENNDGYAWVTAPFSFEEIQKFTTDSTIWNEMN